METSKNTDAKSLVIKDGENVFNYDESLKLFEGNVVLGSKNVSVLLRPETNSMDVTESLNTLKIIKDSFEAFYQTVLKQCSETVVGLANKWVEDGDEKFTAEEIAERIDGDFEISINGKDYVIYFDDDGMFLGHVVMYKGNIESNEFKATLSG